MIDSPARISEERGSMEELLKNYGLPTALLIGISAWAALLVNFLKGLITKELANLEGGQGNLVKEIRELKDDVTRIELMLRLTHDMASQGKMGVEMSRIGKSNSKEED
tara:strand:- start:472 stop:795 length:324 start_codon:yes stop_codon:yes gene_type:complete